jgi:hypothetical protein
MGVFKKYLFLIFFLILGCGLYQNCSPMEGSQSLGGRTPDAPGAFSAVQSLFNQKCVSCHMVADASNNFVGLANYEDISLSGTIAPGDPDNSPLFLSIISGSMPPGPPLSQGEINLIRDWISNGALDDNGTDLNDFTVSAGGDRSLTLPTNNTTLVAIVTPGGSTILRTLWRQVSGPNLATITNAGSTEAQVSNLIAGEYEFEFLAENDQDEVLTDRMRLQVLP